MPTWTPRAAALVAAATLALAGDAGGAEGPSPAADLAALRAGGFVIFLRHAATDPARADRDRSGLPDCEAQGILSEAGRADARALGEALRALGVPIGEVRASPWCRALETARLAFGRAEVDADLANLHDAADDTEKARRAAALQALLARSPAPGTNAVLVGHGFNLAAAARVPIAQGEAALFRPRGAEGFAFVARIGPREWAGLGGGAPGVPR